MIKNGGFPYSVFCTLYESCVSSISDYAGEVFGFNEFDAEMKLHLRAIRSFLGVSKSTAHSGLLSEFNILMPHYRTQLRMIRYYHRMLKCQTNVLAKKIFIWDRNLNKNNVVRSWHSEIEQIFSENDMSVVFESDSIFPLRETISRLQSKMLSRQQLQLKNDCLNLPKLRTFNQLKDFHSTPAYITKHLSFVQRKFIAKLRLGCLGIRIETGRYSRPRIPPESRICQICRNVELRIEDEFHFLFECRAYEHLRAIWLSWLDPQPNVVIETREILLSNVLNKANNVERTAQYIIDLVDLRSKILNNLNG